MVGGWPEGTEKGLRKPLWLFHLGGCPRSQHKGCTREAEEGKEGPPGPPRREAEAASILGPGPAFDPILFQNIGRTRHSEVNRD